MTYSANIAANYSGKVYNPTMDSDKLILDLMHLNKKVTETQATIIKLDLTKSEDRAVAREEITKLGEIMIEIGEYVGL